MGWDADVFSVLDDLESLAEARFGAEREAEVRDRSRAEYAGVSLAARLMASVDRPVALEVEGLGTVRGLLDRVGDGWCLLSPTQAGPGHDWVVPLSAVLGVTGASDRAVPELAWSPIARLGLGSALRRLADAGAPTLVHLRDGSRLEAVVRRVGRDFAELEPAPAAPAARPHWFRSQRWRRSRAGRLVPLRPRWRRCRTGAAHLGAARCGRGGGAAPARRPPSPR
ncbi:MAG: hypothetical protein R2734_05415 [Nocardioides sp.]